MRTLAVLLAAVSMSGCVIHFPHGRDDADGRAHGERTIVVCVLANCRDIFKPEKQEPPTPAPGAISETRRPASLAAGPRHVGAGDWP